jgi:hypothetical protein
MSEVPTFQVVLAINAEGEVAPGELEATAEVVLAALQRHVPFIALGPVLSVDFEDEKIEAECSIMGEDPDDLHAKVARVVDVMLAAANAFEYQGSTTQRLEPALA